MCKGTDRRFEAPHIPHDGGQHERFQRPRGGKPFLRTAESKCSPGRLRTSDSDLGLRFNHNQGAGPNPFTGETHGSATASPPAPAPGLSVNSLASDVYVTFERSLLTPRRPRVHAAWCGL